MTTNGETQVPQSILAVFGKIQSGLARAGNDEGDYTPGDLRDDLRDLQEVCGCLFEADGTLHRDSDEVLVGDGE